MGLSLTIHTGYRCRNDRDCDRLCPNARPLREALNHHFPTIAQRFCHFRILSTAAVPIKIHETNYEPTFLALRTATIPSTQMTTISAIQSASGWRSVKERVSSGG